MKVLITGSNGFIGRNLVSKLEKIDNIEIITFNIEDSFDKIENNINSIDIIFHLAGVMRPKDPKEFYEVNTNLTKRIIDLIISKNLSIPVILTSSVHALTDTDYGKSKKMAEDIIINYGNNSNVFRLTNAFGKWARPNASSVIATFCYNISHNLDIKVDETAEINFIYIDDIIKEFVNIMLGNNPSNKEGNICSIKPTYRVKIKDLAETLYKFKSGNYDNLNEFEMRLLDTYNSYKEME